MAIPQSVRDLLKLTNSPASANSANNRLIMTIDEVGDLRINGTLARNTRLDILLDIAKRLRIPGIPPNIKRGPLIELIKAHKNAGGNGNAEGGSPVIRELLKANANKKAEKAKKNSAERKAKAAANSEKRKANAAAGAALLRPGKRKPRQAVAPSEENAALKARLNALQAADVARLAAENAAAKNRATKNAERNRFAREQQNKSPVVRRTLQAVFKSPVRRRKKTLAVLPPLLPKAPSPQKNSSSNSSLPNKFWGSQSLSPIPFVKKKKLAAPRRKKTLASPKAAVAGPSQMATMANLQRFTEQAQRLVQAPQRRRFVIESSSSSNK
jgi:hypothetical protein